MKMILNPGHSVGLETAQGQSVGVWRPAPHGGARPKGGPAGRLTRHGARTGWSPRTGPHVVRGRRRRAGRQGVEAPAGAAQVQKGENTGQGGAGGDAPRWRHGGGVAEVVQDIDVPGSAVVGRGGAWRLEHW
jgi:hypothetical protein